MANRSTRRGFLAAAGVAGLAGCLGSSPGGDGADAETPTDRPSAGDVTEPGGTATPTARDQIATGTPPGGPDPEAPVPVSDERLPLPMAPEEVGDRAVSGGPPKDGIPSIDDPVFEPADAVGDRLRPGDPVFGVVRDGEAKAYPQIVLVRHEICNDVVGGDPVSVTYCPLTGTAQGFLRGETTFGVSGRLINNNLIMYDRATEAWWPQVLATSVPGPWNGSPGTHTLAEFRVVWTTWERWRSAHPDTVVLTEETGYVRGYDRDPYGSYNPKGGYYDRERTLFQRLNPDDRYHAKRVFVGARTPGGATAFLKDALRERKLMEGSVGGTPVVAAYDPTLDTGYVYRNPDGAALEYRDGSVVVDGSTHDPAELPLAGVLAFDAMWFAWSGFYPDTEVNA